MPKKEFTKAQSEEIRNLRNDKTSYEQISILLKVSKTRVKTFCIDVLKDEVQERYSFVPEVQVCSVPLPVFNNPACKGMDPKSWFALLPRDAKGKNRREIKIQQAEAINICATCEHQMDCLDYGVAAEPYGIWGGTTEAERMYLRRKLNIECAREGGLSSSLRGISRPMMNAILRSGEMADSIFTKPIIHEYLAKHSK